MTIATSWSTAEREWEAEVEFCEREGIAFIPWFPLSAGSLEEGGPLARVKIDVDADQQFVYKISCATCRAKGHRAWSTYRPGGDNGFMAAMDRWTFHLV